MEGKLIVLLSYSIGFVNFDMFDDFSLSSTDYGTELKDINQIS